MTAHLPSASTRLAVALGLAIALATAALFSPLRSADFVGFDDHIYVTGNGFTPRGVTWEGLAWAATNAEFNWHPLTWLSHMLDCQFFGIAPGAHHLSSVAWHLLNTLLLLGVLVRATGAIWPSAFVAALFAIHPLHVEPVAWIAARKDLLSTAGWFAGLLAYVRYVARPSVGRYALVACALALSLMCKGMAITFPVTLLLLDVWPLGRWSAPGTQPRTLVIEKIPLAVLAGAAAAVQVVAQRWSGGLRSLDEVSVGQRLANALTGYATYLRQLFWPSALAIPQPRRPDLPPAWELAAAALLLVGLTAVVARFGRRRPYLFVGWGWYLVTLFPVCGIVSIGDQVTADRYTYVPLIGPFIAIAWSANDAVRHRPTVRPAVVTAAVAALGACALLTWRQVGYWRDSVTLFEHTIAVTGDNTIAQVNLGAALEERGRREEARAHYVEALRINPANAVAHNNLGAWLVTTGAVADGERHLREALRLMPGMRNVRSNLGGALLQRGDTAGALEMFRAAIAQQPFKATAHLGLAQALHGQGRFDEAVSAYARAVALDPQLVSARLPYGEALEAAGRSEDAIVQYREAARLDPTDADAENSLGAALKNAGRTAEAREHFAAALRRNPGHAEAHNNLGVLLFEDGRVADGETHLREAVRLNPGYVWARINLGTLLLRQGRAADARAQFAAAAESDPTNVTAHFDLATALDAEGRAADAAAAYERVLELAPDLPEAQRELTRLRAAATPTPGAAPSDASDAERGRGTAERPKRL